MKDKVQQHDEQETYPERCRWLAIQQRLQMADEVGLSFEWDRGSVLVPKGDFDTHSLRDWEHFASGFFDRTEAEVVYVVDGAAGEVIASFHATEDGGYRIE